MSDHVKVVRNGIAYYIYKPIFEDGELWPHGVNDGILMRLSNFVINLKENRIVKCRYSLEDLVEGYLK